jgi:hypothetical protein
MRGASARQRCNGTFLGATASAPLPLCLRQACQFHAAQVVMVSCRPAIALAVNQGSTVSAKTIVLITPEEMDKAAKKAIAYRAPGQ